MFTLAAFIAAGTLAGSGSFALAVIAAVLGTMASAAVIERTVVRRLYDRGHLDQVLATFGVTMFINELVIVIWGREPLFMSVPAALSGQLEIVPGLFYSAYRLLTSAVAIAIGAGLYILLARTRLGMLVRAGADDRQMVASLGVDIDRLYLIVFVLGAGLAAVAAVMISPLLSVQSGLGDSILILTLVVVVIGGLGSIRGALAASLAVGVFDTIGRIAMPAIVGSSAGAALASMLVYLLMALVLLLRPYGLFANAGSSQ
jgi:branched-chain amino acid transport system permease protein